MLAVPRRADTTEVTLRADDEKITLGGAVELDTTYDILLNGQHVWSLQPGRDTTTSDSRLVAPWPKALHRYLAGRAEVTLREHVTGTVAAVSEHTFGPDRDRQLIGYDNDIDLGYVSAHQNPVDVVREGFRVQRVLQEQGWVVRRGSGARLNVRLRMSDKSMRFVDVFTSHWVNGVFFIPSDVGARLPREAMLPLSTVDLLGWQVPAPADPVSYTHLTLPTIYSV